MKSDSSEHSLVLWLNGRFLPAHEAAVSPLDRGFLYGDGFFETIRAERGDLLYPDDHIKRLRQSLIRFRIDTASEPDWTAISQELIERNKLTEEIASVKFIVSRGTCSGMGLPTSSNPTVCIIAQQYTPPTVSEYRKGWRLHVQAEGFSPPLAGHKSLNYLFFATARQSAMDAGANDAVICDPRDRIAETSSGSILARTEGRWWTPQHTYQLPGITIRHVSRILSKAGYSVEPRSAGLEDLLSAETVWVLNSMMIIMPASHIGDHPIPNPAAEEAAEMRREFVQEGVLTWDK